MEQHVVVAAVLRLEGRLLLCHRSPTRRWFPDVWDFAGGHVEPGESPFEALSRELYEEIGVEPIQLSARPMISKVSDGLDLTVWECVKWNGIAENRQPHEHDEIRWFTKAELAVLTMAEPSYRSALELLLA